MKLGFVCALLGCFSCVQSLRHLRAPLAQSFRFASREDRPLSLFAAVFARANAADRRQLAREMWQEVSDVVGEHGSICARFAICAAGSDQLQLKESLEAEQKSHGDLLILNCTEGYHSLTSKVVSTMQAYLERADDPCYKKKFFMKVDDDTFVSGRHLRREIRNMTKTGELSYMGIMNKDLPIRDPQSQWYEPMELWSESVYPLSAYGGPGYILGRAVVHAVISEGITGKHMLYNEDRAVGVWVHELANKGMQIQYVNVPGTNGCSFKPVTSGSWENYPYLLQHCLEEDTIRCLVQVDRDDDPHASIDRCWHKA